MDQKVDQLKQEISEYYLKDFKKELGWLKSIALLPIEKKIKNLIVGTTDLPEKFNEVEEFWWWKDIISFVTPEIANQIFDFMKQKRIEIQKRQTKEELEALKCNILGIKDEDSPAKSSSETALDAAPEAPANSDLSTESVENTETPTEKEEKKKAEPNSVGVGAVVWWGGAAAVWGLNKLNQSRELKKMTKNIDAKQMKSTVEKAITALQKQKEVLFAADRLSSKQVHTIDKHLKKLTDGLQNLDDEGLDLIKTWKALDGKLPKSLLKSTVLDPKTLSKIEKLAPELVGKSDEEIKALLKAKNIQNIPDELLETLKLAKNADEIKGMTKVLRHGTKANRILQTLAGAMVIDVACFGLDVWMYLETQKEADLIAKVNEVRAKNKRNQANTQLWIGAGSVIAEAVVIARAVSAGTAVGGPFGTVVGLAVGGISAAASMGVDSLYFDVHDFYTQNQEDFLRQSRGKLKHAILQGIHNQQEGNVSLNEKVHHSIAHLFSVEGKDAKEQSLKGACFSMLFLEEVGIGEFKNDSDLLVYLHSGQKKADFLSTLPPESAKAFIDKWEAITTRINLRLEYLEAQLQKPETIKHIKKDQGMQSLTEFFTLSKLYAYQGKEKWKADLTPEENLQAAKSEFFADIAPERLQKFEHIKTENPRLFKEILTVGSLESLENEEESAENYKQNLQLLEKYKSWLKITESYEEMTQLEIPDSNQNAKFIEKLLKADFDLEKVDYPRMKVEAAIWLIQERQERRGMIEISDDPMQNVLFQLAKQLYGYEGANEKESLMQFFSEDGEVHGFYYDNKRKLNEERAVDQGVEKLELWDYSEKEVPKLVEKFLNGELKGRSFSFSWKLLAIWEKSVIDTPTENIDENLQKERKNTIKEILTKELTHRSKENKEKIKSQISAFVQQHAKEGEWIELPYFLLIEARKAGFGDLQRQFFSRKNGKLQILSMQTELEMVKNLEAERSYFSKAREHFTEQEQRYIDRVETAHQKLEQLRSVEWSRGKEDDLDLPQEVEVLISDKYKEREKFKAELLLRDASKAVDIQTQNAYEEFIAYFENLYQGILLQLMKFKISNDLDSFGYYQSAVRLWEQSWFDEKGSLKEGKHPILENKAFRAWYRRKIQEFKVEGKTIQELRNAENKKERNLALQASQLMMRSFIEFGLFEYKADGSIRKISYWALQGHTWFLIDEKANTRFTEDFNTQVQEEIAKLRKAPDLINAQTAIQNKIKSITIHKLNDHETKTIDYTDELQQRIESTQSNVVWQGKRGNISYLPEESALASRGHQVSFEQQGEKFRLKNLEIWLSLKELCRLANFRNRCMHTYKGKKIELERWFLNTNGAWGILPSFKKTWYVDNTMLIARGDLEEYCPICKNDTAMKKITTWLNNQL